jgi:hypothetical protein
MELSADIIFNDPDTLAAGLAVLTKIGFTFTVMSQEESCCEAPAVRIMAFITAALPVHDFLYWVSDLVEPFDGFVCEAGLAAAPSVYSDEAVRPN